MAGNGAGISDRHPSSTGSQSTAPPTHRFLPSSRPRPRNPSAAAENSSEWATARMAKRNREVSPSLTLSPRKTRSGAVRTRSGGSKKEVTAAPKRAAAPLKSPASAKKQKAANAKIEAKPAASTAVRAKASAASSGKTVIIEACTQCQSFKRTALKVKEGLEEHLTDIVVEINPEKPRRGYFEVRNGSAKQVFLSLPEMKRPFQKMKDLVIPDVVKDVVEKLK